jgi:glycerol transport system substrate-binding protein
MDGLCEAQESLMARLEKAGVQGALGPKLNTPKSAQDWFAAPGAPKAKLANEKPAPQTVDYDVLIQSWKK